MTLVDDRSRIAGRFLAARRAAAGLDAYPGDFPASLDEAYAIQDAAIAAWGRPVIGWKVGRVAEPLIDLFGTDRLTGPIFEEARDGAEMPVFAEGFAAGEAEFLLRIGTAPPPGKTALLWRLLTTHAIDTAADAEEIVNLYRLRWRIEISE